MQSAATSRSAPSKYGAFTGTSFICTGHCISCDGVFADGVSTGAGFVAKVVFVDPGQPWKTGVPRGVLLSAPAVS